MSHKEYVVYLQVLSDDATMMIWQRFLTTAESSKLAADNIVNGSRYNFGGVLQDVEVYELNQRVAHYQPEPVKVQKYNLCSTLG